MKDKKPTPLPDNPSELIRLAIHDLTLCERSKKYRINMWTWHDPWHDPYSERCTVCLAGAVMAKSLQAPIDQVRSPSDFTTSDEAKLSALDELRIGNVSYVDWWGKEPPNLPQDRSIVVYAEDHKLFKKQMLQLASEFEAMGL